MSRIVDLPVEMLCRVIRYLDLKSSFRLREVNRRFAGIVADVTDVTFRFSKTVTIYPDNSRIRTGPEGELEFKGGHANRSSPSPIGHWLMAIVLRNKKQNNCTMQLLRI